jgi:hypothetical protein
MVRDMHRESYIETGDNIFLVCECRSPEHVVQITANTMKDSDTVLYIGVQLPKLPWHKRVVRGVKYIFGYQCKYGHWDEAVIGGSEAISLMEFLSDVLEEKQLRLRTLIIERDDN